MKKISILVFVLLSSVMMSAQFQIDSFFDEMGNVNLTTQESSESYSGKMTITHRVDDVAWARIVYRVIDMRFKQNYQLYTPQSNDPVYNSLLKVMLMAVADSMPVYAKDDNGDLRPFFNAGIQLGQPGLQITPDGFDFHVWIQGPQLNMK